MQGLEVVVSLEAQDDIVEISDYIDQTFGMSQAVRFRSEIKKAIDNLEYTSMIYGETGFEYRGKMIYKKHFLPSLIFYYVENEVSYVIRVLRQECEWYKIINRQDAEYHFPEND